MALTLDQLKGIPGLFGADQTIPWGTVNYGDVYGQEQPGSANMPMLNLDPSTMTNGNWGWNLLPTSQTGGKQLYFHYGEPAQGTRVGDSYGAGGGQNGEFPASSLYERVLLGGNDPSKNLGYLTDTAPVARQVQSTPDESWFSQFMQGPAIPLFSFLGAGAMGAGGMGNFLGSFGEGLGAVGGASGFGVGGGAGGVAGGEMAFDPFADFGGDYFSGFQDYLGGSGGISASDLADMQSWMNGEGNFANDILGNGPRLPNGTPVDLFAANTLNQLGNGSSILRAMMGGNGGGSLLGAGIGGLLGALGANSKPAGTTTSVQDIPDWLKPYVIGNLTGAIGAQQSLTGNKAVMDAATPEYLKTIRGNYLNPASNPYLDQTYQHAANLMGANVDSRFEAAGRYGSGAHQGVLQEGLGNLANQIYGMNYQTERGRQAAAVGGAPGFTSNAATAAFAPYTGLSGLFPNVRSTSTPYFTNPLGGILSGATAGSQLGKAIGF